MGNEQWVMVDRCGKEGDGDTIYTMDILVEE